MQPLLALDAIVAIAQGRWADAELAARSASAQFDSLDGAGLLRLSLAALALTLAAQGQREDASRIRAIMMIEVQGRNTPHVMRKLRGLPEVQLLHTTSGKWDLIAEILVEDLAQFDRVLRDVRLVDGVLNSETSILLSSA